MPLLFDSAAAYADTMIRRYDGAYAVLLTIAADDAVLLAASAMDIALMIRALRRCCALRLCAFRAMSASRHIIRDSAMALPRAPPPPCPLRYDAYDFAPLRR